MDRYVLMDGIDFEGIVPPGRSKWFAWLRRCAVEVLGLGTEIVECARVRAMIEEHGERFLTRVYTPEELRYCQSRDRKSVV